MSQPPVSASRAAADLAARGNVRAAVDRLEAAIRHGDGLAAATLAEWRMAGAIVRRDLAAARELYGRAAELGVREAEPVFIALLASGAGGVPRRWRDALARLHALAPSDPAAREQLELLGAMDIDDRGDPTRLPQARPVHPRIALIPGFLSDRECGHLARLAEPHFQPAVVAHPTTGAWIRDPVRRASSAGFPFVRECPVLHAINRRIAAVTDTSYEQGEPLQVLAYRPGEEYKLHSDTLPPGHNQRVATFLVMLDDRFAGGATSFPRLGIELRARRGDAFHFSNVDAQGRPDEAMWHAGLPVTAGRKLILSKWIRAAPLDLTTPIREP